MKGEQATDISGFPRYAASLAGTDALDRSAYYPLEFTSRFMKLRSKQ